MIDVPKLKSVYERYGFENASTKSDDVVVFTIRSGYYHNADIVPLTEDADVEAIFSDFKKAGFACKTREYANIPDVERSLFEGYFTVPSTKKRLKSEYNKFVQSLLSVYSETATYSYIQSSYTINEIPGTTDVVTEVGSRLTSNKPILFLIEAAAGYGKTCTAYELLNDIVSNEEDRIPLKGRSGKLNENRLHRTECR